MSSENKKYVNKLNQIPGLKSLGEFPASRRSVLKAETLARKIGDHNCLIWVLQARAELESHEGRYEEAKRYYLESQEIANSHGHKIELAHSYLGLAEIARKSRNGASDFYKKALKIYRSIGSKWGINECRLRKAFLESKTSQYPEKPLNFA